MLLRRVEKEKERGGVGDELDVVGMLAVQDSEDLVGALVDPPLRLGGQEGVDARLLEVGVERETELLALVGPSDAVDLDLQLQVALHTPHHLQAHRDQLQLLPHPARGLLPLRARSRLRQPLRPVLVEAPLAVQLGPFVAEHSLEVEQLLLLSHPPLLLAVSEDPRRVLGSKHHLPQVPLLRLFLHLLTHLLLLLFLLLICFYYSEHLFLYYLTI